MTHFHKGKSEMDVDYIGGFPTQEPDCRGCGKPLLLENAWMTDGCPCNHDLGVNNMNETRWRLLMQLQQNQSRKLDEARGTINVLADKLARYTGRTVPDEIAACQSKRNDQ